MNNFDDFFNGKKFYGALGMNNLNTPLSTADRSSYPIPGFHIFSTKPFFARKKDGVFKMRETDIPVIKLSAAAWKRYNGNIYLITDEEGEKYVKEQNLTEIYDGVFPILGKMNYGIDHNKFWSAAKLEALSVLKAPCAVIDMDLVIWKPLDLTGCALAVTHKEELTPSVYPPFEVFKTAPYYHFPEKWTENALPCNSSFMYFGDEEFKKRYVKYSIDFMQAERATEDDGVICACFAEQRILGECAAENEVKVHTLLELNEIEKPQDILTHTWNAKKMIASEPVVKERFLRECIEKEKEFAQLK